MTTFCRYKVWNCSRANLLISDKTFQTSSHVITPWTETRTDHFSTPQHPTKTTWHTPQSNITNYISNTYNTKPQLTNKKTIQNRSNKNWFTVTAEQNNTNIYNSFDYPIAKAHNLFFCELETEIINSKRLDSFVRVQPFCYGLECCPRRIRTTTNRTKTCCATITP